MADTFVSDSPKFLAALNVKCYLESVVVEISLQPLRYVCSKKKLSL
jgi:hypothetical protein